MEWVGEEEVEGQVEDPAESSRQEISIGEDCLAADDASWGR